MKLRFNPYSLRFKLMLASTVVEAIMLSFLLVNSTRLINDSFWQPKHLLARVMSRFMMRPKSRRIRQQVLRNLKELAEQDTAVTAA